MSMIQTTTEHSPSDTNRCPQCNTILPLQATFCVSCGERINKKNSLSLLQDDSDIKARYRITSLVRRRPYVNLFFAIDNQQQRPVAIRDIDISSLNDETRASATEFVQREYDLLRREHIPDVMPVIDLRHFQDHLFVITSWPFPSGNNGRGGVGAQLHTLQDVLQSGIGLPEEQVARAWIERLCRSLDRLHSYQIVIGDLDPQTIVLSGDKYDGQPMLMVSWLPLAIRGLLPRASLITSATHFSVPEALLGKVEPRSDIYSLGAILYLLLTGFPPDDPPSRVQRRFRSPRELNPRISSGIDQVVMRAMAIDRSERFQTAGAMLEALLNLRSNSKASQPAKTTSMKQSATDASHIDQIASIDTVLITPLSETNSVTWQPPRRPPVGTRHPQRMPLQEDAPPPRTAWIEQQPAEAKPQPSLQQTGRAPIGNIPATVQPSVAAQDTDTSFLQQLSRMVFGEQQHSTKAAAIIETPLRVQPNQGYAIRIQLMGRDEPMLPASGRKTTQPKGLSGLVHGDLVSIEVRSVLHQSYAYIIQQAAVNIPARGFAAEVTIPMQPLSSGPSGRRDRLHIFFLDEMRRPLYEKPFVVELFVSHLVQPGREGHNVLTIPL